MTNHPLHDLLPHKPPMILIDDIIEHGPDHIHTILTIRDCIPFYKDGLVPTYVSLEYMAQTVAVWSGLMGQQQNLPPKIGFLLGTRQLRLNASHFKNGDILHVFGNLKFNDGEMASFDCRVDVNGNTIASALLNVFQPKDINPFLQNQ